VSPLGKKKLNLPVDEKEMLNKRIQAVQAARRRKISKYALSRKNAQNRVVLNDIK